MRGRFQEPRTLHAYLYCLNEPVNWRDPTGRYALNAVMDAVETYTLGVDILTMGISRDDDVLFYLGELVAMATPAVYAMSLATMGASGDVDDLFRGKGKGKRHTPDEEAFKELLGDRKRSGKRLDNDDVGILKDWAHELGLTFRDDRGTDHWIGGSHISVDGVGRSGKHIRCE